MTRVRLVVLLWAVVLAACGGPATTGAIAWRDIDMTLPDGWVVIDDLGTAMYVGNGEGGEEEGDPGDLTVGLQFSVEDTPSIDDWRGLVSDRGGDVEIDATTELDGVPASVLQFTLPGSGDVIPATRERVLTVPSRDIVILAQAIPVRGEADGGQLFLDKLDEIDQLLDSIDFGAPFEE